MEGPTVVLVASSTESNITVWDVHTGTALTSFKTNASPTNGLSLLGRDYLVASQLGRGGSLHFWAWHKDQLHQRCFAAEPLTAVAATPDGTFCAAGAASGAVFVWEASSGRLLRTWPAHYKAVTCLAFSDSGAVLVTGGEDTQVHAWLLAEVLDATAGQQMQMGAPLLRPMASWSDHTLPITCLAVGAGDAAALVASGSLDRTIRLRSLAEFGGGGDGGMNGGAGGAPLRSITLPAAVQSVALDPGEHAVYAGCADGSIYDISLVGSGGDGGIAEDGGMAPLAAADTACPYPALEGHSRTVTTLAFTPDAAMLVSGSEDCSVRVWDLRSRQSVRVLQNPAKGPVTAVLVLPQPPFMQVGGSHTAGSGHQSGRRGPQQPQPLAPFSKYPNAAGALQPWEGGLVVLDGTASLEDEWPHGGTLVASAAGLAGVPEGGVAFPQAPLAAGVAGGTALSGDGGGAAVGGGVDAAALQEENKQLREQLEKALATARQWGDLNTQLQQLCSEKLLLSGHSH